VKAAGQQVCRVLYRKRLRRRELFQFDPVTMAARLFCTRNPRMRAGSSKPSWRVQGGRTAGSSPGRVRWSTLQLMRFSHDG
jgi:hypothetical protein